MISGLHLQSIRSKQHIDTDIGSSRQLAEVKMSSGSDVDEFYDAVDVTPARHTSRSSNGTKTDSPRQGRSSPNLDSSLDTEEGAGGVDVKRNSLERQQNQLKAEETERRRRKLEEMRSLMADDTTPARPPPPKPPRLFDTDNEAQVDPGDTEGQLKVCTDMDTGVHETSELITKEGGLWEGPKRTPSPNNGAAGKPQNEPELKVNIMASLSMENVNLNLDSPEDDMDKVLTKHIPEVDVPREEDDPLVITEDKTPEPDIVQSTKASTLRPSKLPPPRPPPPVAPPRRKRNKPPEVSGASPEESVDTLSAESKGLPTKGLPTPTSTVYSLTKELEHSLDLQSATAGSRMVTARQDELSAKAELTEEEKTQAKKSKKSEAEKQDKQMSPKHTGDATGAAAAGDEPDKDKAKNTVVKREKEMKMGEDGHMEVPKSEQRPRSNSGTRFLTDKEILEMVSVLNLDTGEKIPLSLAEEKLPRCVNPLSLHIMRRTKEYSSDSSLHKHGGSDDEQKDDKPGTKTIRSVKPVSKRTRAKLKMFIGKTVNKIKSVADEVLHDKDGNALSDDDDEMMDGRRMIKIKAASAHKGPYDFDLLVPVQDLRGEQSPRGANSGAVWTMKFSNCGRLLATGGQDNFLRIWVLKDAYAYFDDMRQKYSEATKVSPTPSQDSLSSQSSEHSAQAEEGAVYEDQATPGDEEEDEHSPFMRKPFCIYRGHTADLLDLSWSKNYFILSSSMDKTVRLWHVSRKECLCCFQHIDFVTAIAFLPRDDRYFLSGSLDGKLRLWNIPDKKVALWNEVIGQSKLITAANFCLNGRFAVVGTYDGRCVFYTTDQLKYYTQIHVRSTRGRNARGRKVTGIEPVPGEDKILVTSNDSRVRLYDLRDLTLTCKFKGGANNSSQIKASFSHSGKFIICGSEDHFVYIWRTQHEFYKYTSARRDRSVFWEGIKAHSAVVTAAIFAPQPGLIIKSQFEYEDSDNRTGPPEVRGEVIVSADFNGAIKVFINKFKPGSGN